MRAVIEYAKLIASFMWVAFICVLVAMLVMVAFSMGLHGAELELCYDRARWVESTHVAQRHGTIVLNVDSGRGSNAAESKAWDEFGSRLRVVGGKTLGYVDFKNEGSHRKTNDDVINESIAWIDHGHGGVFLDDASDNGADADVVRAIKSKRPSATIIANPGCKVSGPLKNCGAILCESEYPDTIYYSSAVVIAFVANCAVASDVRKTATESKVALLAVEPRSLYHVAGKEFQKPNPFTP
jgi:hypothetical protein